MIVDFVDTLPGCDRILDEGFPAIAPIHRNAERELFFWTARQALKLVILTALTAYFVVSVIEGRVPGYSEVLRLLATAAL